LGQAESTLGGGEMREIKFRAWDKENKFMLKIFDNTTRENWYLPQWKGRHEVMQYTGLKDKNNKEIYEGDVLHCDGHWNLYAVWDEENARFAFLCTDWVVTQGHPIQPNISSYCIIGNIHENPELLGGE
jgi:hypothetical protein